MLVVHSQAERILKEYGETGPPGFETLEYELGKPDDNGHAELKITNNAHATPEAFAKAAGIVEAVSVDLEPKCIEAPQIIGLPNVGQKVVASAGVWEEPDDAQLTDPGVVTHPRTQIRWLYDKNEEDPVVIPEGDPHDGQNLTIPALALGREIFLRVTRGKTTVYSEPLGPIEGGLTEFTFPGQPVPDADVVSADPGARRRSGASQSTRGKSPRKQTPATGGGKPTAGLAKPGSGPKRRPTAKQTEPLVEKAAKEKTPAPAADPLGE